MTDRFENQVSSAEPVPGVRGRTSDPEPGGAARTSDEVRARVRTVLVADDEAEVRRIVARTLAWGGFRVIEASGGAEAVALFEAHAREVDAVLLDVNMPGVSGIESLERIRASRPGTPAVLVSGYREKFAAGHLAPGSYDGFLSKPFSPEELLRAVDAVLRSEPRDGAEGSPT